MCSVTWLIEPDGYQLFFNRDEQKARPLALPPQQVCIQQTSVLMPIDPKGRGSWISLNEHGLSLCLLNYYQGKVPAGELVSRGLLLRHLSPHQRVEDIVKVFRTIQLKRLAPFTLLAFDPSLTARFGDVMAFEWNGDALRILPVDSPLFSSAVHFDAVQHYRQKLYCECTAKEKTRESLLAFHRAFEEKDPHLSPCMVREDAHTVSFTAISVNRQHKRMSYLPGLPVLQLSEHALEEHGYHINPAAAAANDH
ncbi:NRDE family protein [Vibrio vulnificus]|uniref:NRDE family protein n=1 Tax=Vibrio vulnificus TaxID=672 RepID=UPI000CD2FBF1|nr:NRDE family protein [Vibrio vulnificus]EGQ7929805.1 NRDE family protein [Vibrio vulnificus]EGQ7933878.1 NRDE family protein [Vibrio vulnificus]EGQ7949761.1 NRDE family protein [Vibrio vulnificus]EGQ7989586.1 NRDE family protein [Vibrio vulnificus]EGQ9293566.1 NRDE family protein [Vibrio vulnificus]